MFDYRKQWENPPWYSSYEKNNYGELFYGLMRVYQPLTVVELGTKAGYSAYHMARGLTDNGTGKLDCYDLWEEYEFNSVPKAVAQKNLRKFKDIVTLTQRDAIGVDKQYKEIDILHIDLSNKGEILEPIVPQWIDKVRQCIIIEGGSDEHDKIPWMIQFKKMPVKKWLQEFAKKRTDITYFTVEPSLSITLIRKTT
jgi:predicted O-methyltransferase YrrM